MSLAKGYCVGCLTLASELLVDKKLQAMETGQEMLDSSESKAGPNIATPGHSVSPRGYQGLTVFKTRYTRSRDYCYASAWEMSPTKDVLILRVGRQYVGHVNKVS